MDFFTALNLVTYNLVTINLAEMPTIYCPA